MTLVKIRSKLRGLYLGTSTQAIRFQVAMALIDLVILIFFVLGPYLGNGRSYFIIDYAIAFVIACELVARILVATDFKHWLMRPMTWVDILVLGTLLFPQQLSNFAFLRAFRIWSLGQSKAFAMLMTHAGCARWGDVIKAVINFITFLFLVTGFVYTTFFYHDAGINGFVDALYFTVATITTTGFGDITLPGTAGKLTSIVTMIFGISLFVRLAQTIVRPNKVAFPCPQCGLQRHDHDAVHCKACGHILNIPDDSD
ncbi:voltage-gated potassium channel [Pararhizobium capsulatum DSM 1112]|uniref:Voltage-gated potassium channel n=1 Tax=Pararhizobium capsulatum DSM 1112 TaxID=1121113 RepID=A0ABU0BJL1_9HYPH|nr:potassium channel family protein [Pararhizobium capsulatum]MDQ0317871.1 voltage-gated potassium channel [Pararhizobium capsulatum DSM 1112]